LVNDPGTAAKEVTTLLAEAKSEDAIAAVKKYIETSPSFEVGGDQWLATLKSITSQGPADVTVEKMWGTNLGNAVEQRIDYLHFPLSDDKLVLRFVFVRYTFMKIAGGWQMTTFDFSTGGAFPPKGWTLSPGSP
jgi:hypothetical protein